MDTEMAADAVTVEALEEAAVTPAQPELLTTKASIKTNSTKENPRERCILPHSVALLNAIGTGAVVEGAGGRVRGFQTGSSDQSPSAQLMPEHK